MRPECRDSNSRGVSRDRQGRTANTKSGRATKGLGETECWVGNPYAHWSNMHAANCCTWRCWGGIPHMKGRHITRQWLWYHQWVMLIICVVTVITDGVGPHTGLISHVWQHYRPLLFPQSEQAITNLSAVIVLAEEVPVSCPQEPAQLKLLSHSQLKGKLPLFSFWFTLTEQILQT